MTRGSLTMYVGCVQVVRCLEAEAQLQAQRAVHQEQRQDGGAQEGVRGARLLAAAERGGQARLHRQEAQADEARHGVVAASSSRGEGGGRQGKNRAYVRAGGVT